MWLRTTFLLTQAMTVAGRKFSLSSSAFANGKTVPVQYDHSNHKCDRPVLGLGQTCIVAGTGSNQPSAC